MECGDPAAESSEVEKLAWLLPLRVPLPNGVFPSKKVTNPVGVVPLTVAVNMTVSPSVMVAWSGDRLVVVAVGGCARTNSGA